MEVISFCHVTKTFGSFKALQDVSFNCHSNKILGIVGNNGSGKTTILNIVGNLLTYSSGVVKCFGKIVDKNSWDYRRQLGMVLSDHPLIDDFKPSQYLEFVGKFQGLGPGEIIERTEKILSSFNLPNKKIGSLSSGNRVKLAIASSLIHNPTLLLYDEPFNFLDVSSVNNLKEILLSLRLKKTIVITSHNLDILCDLCDEIVVIEEGKTLGQFEVSPSKDSFKKELLKYLVSDKHAGALPWLD